MMLVYLIQVENIKLLEMNVHQIDDKYVNSVTHHNSFLQLKYLVLFLNNVHKLY